MNIEDHIEDATFEQKKSLYKIFEVGALKPENISNLDKKTSIMEEKREDAYQRVNIHLDSTPRTNIEDSLRGNGDVRLVGVSLGKYSTSVTLRVGSEEEEKVEVTIFFGAPEDIEGGEE